MKLFETPELVRDDCFECYSTKTELFACTSIVHELWDVPPDSKIKFHGYSEPGRNRWPMRLVQYHAYRMQNYVPVHFIEVEDWHIVAMHPALCRFLRKLYEQYYRRTVYVECEIL